MTKKLPIALLLICFTSVLFGQIISSFPKLYSLQARAKGMIQTKLNDYIVLGDNGANPILFKASATGQTIWYKETAINNLTNYQLEKVALCNTHDSNHLLLSNLNVPNISNTILVTKFSSTGDTLWTKNYSDNLNYLEAASVTPTNDNGFIIVSGSVNKLANNTRDLLLVKINASGVILWTKKMSVNLQKLYGLSLVENSSGDLFGYVFGQNQQSPNDNVIIVKLSSSGNLIWDKAFSNQMTSLFANTKKIVLHGNSVYFTSSDNQGQITLLSKIDTSGNLIWTKQFDPNFSNNYAQANIIMDNLNNLIVFNNTSGFIGFGTNIAKLDTNGSIIWSKNAFISASDALVAANNRLLITGGELYGISPLESSIGQEIGIIELDSNGNSAACVFGSGTNLSSYITNTLTLNLINSNSSIITNSTPLYFINNSQTQVNSCVTIFGNLSQKFKPNIKVFPNPSNGTLVFKTENYSNTTIIIHDALGQIVSETETISETTIVNLQNQPKGFYYYMILSNNHSIASGKLILE
jgi:Secretion system C-terminal sorting domain